jgi:hypothetical protein
MEKPIKVVPSSSGGRIAYYSWGLIHTANRAVSSDDDDKPAQPRPPREHK